MTIFGLQFVRKKTKIPAKSPRDTWQNANWWRIDLFWNGKSHFNFLAPFPSKEMWVYFESTSTFCWGWGGGNMDRETLCWQIKPFDCWTLTSSEFQFLAVSSPQQSSGHNNLLAYVSQDAEWSNFICFTEALMEGALAQFSTGKPAMEIIITLWYLQLLQGCFSVTSFWNSCKHKHLIIRWTQCEFQIWTSLICSLGSWAFSDLMKM